MSKLAALSDKPAVSASADPRALEQLAAARVAMKKQIARVIIGQEAVLDDLLTAVFAGGHCLMVGVPGLAKTLMVQTLARCVDLSFSRIQFTPDLMPADITGTEVMREDKATGERRFEFVQGPVFGHIVLADEINRTPPKTQAALLQAMQERQVSSAGKTYDLPRPFFVLATQNPIEQEGTYPLPEAQLDRFMFMLKVGYPSAAEELAIARFDATDLGLGVTPVLHAGDVTAMQKLVRALPVSDHVALFAVKLARATRPDDALAPAFVKEFVTWGVGPRAVQHLVTAAKARAALAGEFNLHCEHVRQVAPLVLRHRIVPNYHAQAQGVDADKLVQRLLAEVPEPGPGEHEKIV